jgi:hypothetical protein
MEHFRTKAFRIKNQDEYISEDIKIKTQKLRCLGSLFFTLDYHARFIL